MLLSPLNFVNLRCGCWVAFITISTFKFAELLCCWAQSCTLLCWLSTIAFVFAQSTIDMLNFWRDSKLAKEKGNTLVHPYNLGPLRNFQVTVVSAVF